MPKPCILVSSCKRDVENGMNLAVRDTWATDSKLPYFFILGDGNKQRWADEVILNVPDDYLSLPFKTKHSIEWAVRCGFTHIFRAFTDTFIDTHRLLYDSNYASHPYIGNRSKDGFVHGGPGYWLGPKAIKILIDAPIEKSKFENDKYEDQWVGRVLALHGIHCRDDKNYSMGWSYGLDEQDPLETNEIITVHLSGESSGQYDKDWMGQVYAKRYKLPYKPTVPRLKGCNCKRCQKAALDKATF